MIILLSPAKSLNEDIESYKIQETQARFLDESKELIKTLKQLSTTDLSELMSLSSSLSELNVSRFQKWKQNHTSKNSKPNIYMFNGDVYDGFNARTLNAAQLSFAQDHLRILSGLYGLLRPGDYIQPYRLEMGTKLIHGDYKNLYQFWASKIAQLINEDLKATKSNIVVNLASNEYFKSVDKKTLDANIVTPSFLDEKNGKFKIISFLAKRARGSMARFIVENGITKHDDLKGFNVDGYRFDKSESTDSKLVFKREQSARNAA